MRVTRITCSIFRVRTIYVVAFAIFFLGIACSSSPVAVHAEPAKVTVSRAPSVAIWTPGNPIVITSDNAWAYYSPIYGSGTWDDPYVIANFTINGNNQDCISISNTRMVFRIVNCTCTGAGSGSAGIYLNNATNGLIFNNTCTNDAYGIFIDQLSTNNTITINSCPGNQNYGIYLNSTNNNTLTWNICTKGIYTPSYGIFLDNSSNNTLIGNSGMGSSQDGIYLNSADNNNTVVGNNCTGDSHNGITLQNTCYNNTILGNNCTGIPNDGIFLQNSANNTISGNNCTESYNGIYLNTACTNNVLTGNLCANCSFMGIYVTSSNDNNNAVAGNICDNCTDTGHGGIYLSGNNNTAANNNCTGDSVGIQLVGDYSNVTSNNCTAFTLYGIKLYNAINNSVAWNTCTGNAGSYGIFLYFDCYNNTVIGNNCSGDPIDGIMLQNSCNNNTIVANNCTGNSACGILLSDNANGNDVTENTCFSNYLGFGIDNTGTSAYNLVTQNRFKKNIENPPISDNNSGPNYIYGNIFLVVPAVNFTASATAIQVGQSITFTDGTTGGDAPLAYQWSFGDGTGNWMQPSLTHQFTSAGSRTVVLTVTDIDGDASTCSMTISVQGSGGTSTPTNFPTSTNNSIQVVPAGVNVISCTAGGKPLANLTINASSSLAVNMTFGQANPTSASLPDAVGFLVISVNDTSSITYPVTIKVFYNASVLAAAGISPANLILWYYNETTSTWVPLTGTVNVTEQSVTVQIMHLSTFGLAPVQSSFDPHLLGVIFGISAVAIVAIAAALNYRRAGKSGNPRSPQKLKLKRNPRSEDKTPDAPVE